MMRKWAFSTVPAMLLAACFLGCSVDGANRCECPDPDVAELSREEMEELFEEAVDAGYVTRGTAEFRNLRREVRNGNFADLYFGAEWHDLGYDPDALWLEPRDGIYQNCPFEIHWEACFAAEDCRMPTESKAFTEVLRIYSDPTATEAGQQLEYARDSIANGACAENFHEHSGLYPAGLWHARITVTDIQPWDCAGDTDLDVSENNNRILQFEVGCYCGEQGWYDAEITDLSWNSSTRNARWTVAFGWESCLGRPAESKVIQEHLVVTRQSDGTIVEDLLRSVPLLMGDSTARSFDAADLEADESYLLEVEISGGDCNCDESMLYANNSSALNFSL